jgi:hypothetical protein
MNEKLVAPRTLFAHKLIKVAACSFAMCSVASARLANAIKLSAT